MAHLRKFFESPQQSYVARHSLSACRQEPGKPSFTFANRLLSLVRAATAGQDEVTLKERMLEEFVARLHSDIRYFAKLHDVRPGSDESSDGRAAPDRGRGRTLDESSGGTTLGPGKPRRPILRK